MTLIWTYIPAKIISKILEGFARQQELNENTSFMIYASHLLQEYALIFHVPRYIWDLYMLCNFSRAQNDQILKPYYS